MSRWTLQGVDARTVIEPFLRADALLHIYELGDLDPFFWPKTTWYGAYEGTRLEALALRYAAPGLDAVLLLERERVDAARWLGEQLATALPGRFYAHLSPGLVDAFGSRTCTAHGRFDKMTLSPSVALPEIRDGVRRLGNGDVASLRSLYAASYPGNWFDDRMLQTGQYFGGFDDERLCAVAGIHVFGPEQGVAALGNVATHPAARGHGWARAVTAAVCRSLRASGVELIGLNVNADNVAAIACYRRLGFTKAASYEEWMVEPA
ncbi:MAG: GNAT family N-acetyltransferase [Myxococcota bacterium]